MRGGDEKRAACSPSPRPATNDAIGFGGGVRYRLSEADRMNIGLDLAFGGGTPTIYFRLGEAF